MGKILHASGSGYFPGCIQNGVGFWSLEKAMDIYWRIRTWELNPSITYSIPIDGVPTELTVSPSAPMELTYRFGYLDSYPPITSEEELVCGAENTLIVSTEEYSGDYYGEISFSYPQKSGLLYSPGFLLNFNFNAEIYDFGSINFVGIFYGASVGDKSFSIYGSEPIPFFFTQFAEYFTFVDATLSLEPKEWWSYGGMYNTNTGARL